MGACWLHGDAVERVFATDEYGKRDIAAGDAGEYGEYVAGVFGCAGWVLYGDGQCRSACGELCGLHGYGSEWDCVEYVGGAGL
jgi:hypothetical protein